MNSSISNSKTTSVQIKARKIFLCALLSSACFFCVFLATSEWLLRVHVAPNDNFVQQIKLYRAIPPHSVGIAVFGDSHTSQGFSAEKNMINLGMAGESFYQIGKKIKHFLTQQRPELIILQISPHMFAQYRLENPERDYDRYFESPSHQTNWQEVVLLLDPVYQKRLLKYWITFLQGDEIKRANNSFTSFGQVRITTVMSETENFTSKDLKNLQRRVRQHTPVMQEEAHKTLNQMRTVIREVLKQEIKLCLVTYPVSSDYRKYASRIETFQTALDTLKTLAAEEKVSYFSYYDFIDDNSAYLDPDHLTARQSDKFTEVVLNDCEKPQSS